MTTTSQSRANNAAANLAKQRRQNRAEDLHFLLTHGEHPDNAARRVGLKDAQSARDFAHRHHYPHLTHLLKNTTP